MRNKRNNKYIGTNLPEAKRDKKSNLFGKIMSNNNENTNKIDNYSKWINLAFDVRKRNKNAKLKNYVIDLLVKAAVANSKVIKFYKMFDDSYNYHLIKNKTFIGKQSHVWNGIKLYVTFISLHNKRLYQSLPSYLS